jgi:hypothetical protein
VCARGAKRTVERHELHDWIGSQANDLARQLDTRNGNQWFSSQLKADPDS